MYFIQLNIICDMMNISVVIQSLSVQQFTSINHDHNAILFLFLFLHQLFYSYYHFIWYINKQSLTVQTIIQKFYI